MDTMTIALIFLGGFVLVYLAVRFLPRGGISPEKIFIFAIKNGATAVRLEVGKPPFIEVDGEWRKVNVAGLTPGFLASLRPALRQGPAIALPPHGEAVARRNEETLLEFELKRSGKA